MERLGKQRKRATVSLQIRTRASDPLARYRSILNAPLLRNVFDR